MMQAYTNSQTSSSQSSSQTQRNRPIMYNQQPSHDRLQGNLPGYGFVQLPASNAAYGSNNAAVAALTQGFNGMSLQGNNPMLPASRLNLGHGQAEGNGSYLFMQNGALLCASQNYAGQPVIAPPGLIGAGFNAYDPPVGQYAHFAENLGFVNGYQHLPVTPQTQAALPRRETVPIDVPGFADRKSSLGSTHERETSSSPDTPYMAAATHADHNVIIARADHSPHVQYEFSTPSPQPGLNHFDTTLMGNALSFHGATLSKESVKSIVPGIPQAITAVYETRVSRKSLEASLYNANGTTNVYIRGFPPETDDAMLLSYAAHFGRVLTSKAMIDNQTGSCKGFGFACYHTFQEAENCIRGFYSLGYDVSFARVTSSTSSKGHTASYKDQESFNARLKALSDPTSTNLYVSNLPRSMTEAELAAVFMGYAVESSRIQRDENGNSKGVGFARFKTRKECDEVIEKFNGQLLGQERMPFQIRYADTQEQKRFKQVTQERRDYKSGEYNTAAYGPTAPTFHQVQPIHVGSTASIPQASSVRAVNGQDGWSAHHALNQGPRDGIMGLNLTANGEHGHANGSKPANKVTPRSVSSSSAAGGAEVCLPRAPAIAKGVTYSSGSSSESD